MKKTRLEYKKDHETFAVIIYYYDIISHKWRTFVENIKGHETFTLLFTMLILHISGQWTKSGEKIKEIETFAIIVYYVDAIPHQ